MKPSFGVARREGLTRRGGLTKEHDCTIQRRGREEHRCERSVESEADWYGTEAEGDGGTEGGIRGDGVDVGLQVTAAYTSTRE